MTPQVWNKRDPHCPPDAVYVGRPSKWGNSYKISPTLNRAECIAAYKMWLNYHVDGKKIRDAAKIELRGKHLVCWCKPHSCHADILLEIANS